MFGVLGLYIISFIENSLSPFLSENINESKMVKTSRNNNGHLGSNINYNKGK